MGAADVPVRLFREILIWPLAVEIDGDSTPRAAVGKLRKKLTEDRAWTAIRDLRRHLDRYPDNDAPLSAEAYAEVVYFQPFVQRFLFPAQGQSSQPAVHLFRRKDVKRVRLESGGRACELSVDRVHLYLFDSGIAVLAVEVATVDGRIVRDAGTCLPGLEPPIRDLTLRDVQWILSGFRHAYPPFFQGTDDGTIKYGQCLDRVEWLCNDASEPERPLTGERDEPAGLRRHLTKEGQPPTFAHWQALLTPLPMDALRHVVDDRIPTMALVGVEDPHAIGRGDLMRLCFADPPDTDPLPYAREFLREFEKDHCYDRFWQEDGGWLSTRYLCSGYNFAMVGWALDASKGKKGFLREHGEEHFRRHYFQLGLLAHHQKAALLTLSDAVSLAAGKGRLDGEMDRLHLRALEFTHRFWFTDVTNQVQGQELFELWTRHLNTRAIFDQVNREVTESSDYRSTQAALRLNRIATAGLVLALTTGVLGMNVLADGRWTKPGDWAELGVVLSIMICGMAVVGWAYRRAWSPWMLKAKRIVSATLFLATIGVMPCLGMVVYENSAEKTLIQRLSAAWAELTAR